MAQKALLVLLVARAAAGQNATVTSSTDHGNVTNRLLLWLLVLLPSIYMLPSFVRFCSRRISSRNGVGTMLQSRAASETKFTQDRKSRAIDALEAAKRAGEAQRDRVSGTVSRAGWFAVCLMLSQMFGVNVLGHDHIGPRSLWSAPVAPGVGLWFLKLRPTDAEEIRKACRMCFCIFWALLLLSISNSVGYIRRGYVLQGILEAMNGSAGAVLTPFLWPTLGLPPLCGGSEKQREPMPPRRQLQRLWLVVRAMFAEHGFLSVLWIVAPTCFNESYTPESNLGRNFNLGGNVILALSFFSGALLPTPANRGRVLRWLGSLGKRGSQQQEAASVASLLGRGSAVDAFADAVKNFRAMPLRSLTRDHLVDNKPDPTLHALTVSAELGQVAAFVSHSWHDNGSSKFDHLHDWAEQSAGELVWLDKACIDQSNIDKCLEGLPIFLAGCRTLLILAGPTYATRLWCMCCHILNTLSHSYLNVRTHRQP
jgi:hypothetical protein